jgi:hypothetical protein
MKETSKQKKQASLIPSFENQSFRQVINICKEFGCTWENRFLYQGDMSLTYDVYIYGDKLYTRI